MAQSQSKFTDFLFSDTPPVGFHFVVVFYFDGFTINPLDTHFQKVSGISSEIKTIDLDEGGENLYTHRLPNKVSYGNLTLERGFVSGSPLNIEFNVAMSTLKVRPGNVLVALLNDDGLPVSAWLFWKTYPVKWSISDLDANSNTVAIESMDLAYTRMQALKV
ncbi:MAG: phage tail protein [Proteobacteria bacterium]|nr:phage tail protein [Pseudomonadota bacterium]